MRQLNIKKFNVTSVVSLLLHHRFVGTISIAEQLASLILANVVIYLGSSRPITREL